nr:MAG TPA: hypothetical protein [Caudoviricetes sp.]
MGANFCLNSKLTRAVQSVIRLFFAQGIQNPSTLTNF